MSIPRSWFFLNSVSVWIFASGNFASAAVSTFVFSGVTPPFMFTKVKTFVGLGNSLSKRFDEMVTSPYGEPPFGGAKMPRTSRCIFSPVGTSTTTVEPDEQAVILGERLRDERAVAAELSRSLGAAGLPLDVDHLRDVGRHGGDADPVAEGATLAGADAGHDENARNALQSVGGRDRDGREVVLRRQRVVGAEDRIDGSLEGRLEARREHGDERDEREPDHQRGRGRRRSSRIPDRVAARERSGRAADPRRRPAEDACERRHERRREHRHADEECGGADADREQPCLRRQPADEQADEHERERCDDRQRRHVRAETREARHGEDGALADRRDRRHPRRAHGRAQRCDQRDPDADDERDDDRPRREDRARLRQVDAEADEERVQPLGEAETRGRARSPRRARRSRRPRASPTSAPAAASLRASGASPAHASAARS